MDFLEEPASLRHLFTLKECRHLEDIRRVGEMNDYLGTITKYHNAERGSGGSVNDFIIPPIRPSIHSSMRPMQYKMLRKL
jgi:hypothetical protein